MKFSLPLGLLVLAALVSSGCSAENGNFGAGVASASSERGATAPLLQRVQDATGSVPHSGERLYEAHTYENGADLVVAYTERVIDRGDGCYSIEPLNVQSNAVDEFLFLGLQRERQAFFRRYRDFEIRDLDQFLSNYTVTDEGVLGSVAGRTTSTLLARSHADGHSYRISIDEETALVLAYREELADGTLVSSMRYEQFELGVPAEFDCFSNQVREEPLLLRSDFSEQVSADVWSPALTPDGYVPYEAARVRDPRGFDWFKLTFTDGVETLFFLQRLPSDGLLTAPSTTQAGAPEGAHDDRVLVYEVGSLSVVQGTLQSHEVMAVGKVDSHELLSLLDSARR